MGHMKANAENARRFVGAVLDELCREDDEGIVGLVEARHLKGSVMGGISTSVEGRGDEARGRLEWLFPGYF